MTELIPLFCSCSVSRWCFFSSCNSNFFSIWFIRQIYSLFLIQKFICELYNKISRHWNGLENRLNIRAFSLLCVWLCMSWFISIVWSRSRHFVHSHSTSIKRNGCVIIDFMLFSVFSPSTFVSTWLFSHFMALHVVCLSNLHHQPTS